MTESLGLIKRRKLCVGLTALRETLREDAGLFFDSCRCNHQGMCRPWVTQARQTETCALVKRRTLDHGAIRGGRRSQTKSCITGGAQIGSRAGARRHRNHRRVHLASSAWRGSTMNTNLLCAGRRALGSGSRHLTESRAAARACRATLRGASSSFSLGTSIHCLCRHLLQ